MKTTKAELLPTSIDSEIEKYEVEVKTSDEKGAGTNSNIKLVLAAVNKTVEFNLDKKYATSKNKDLFETGQVDAFSIYAKEIGNLKKITVLSDKKGLGSDWMLQHVKIAREKEMIMFTANKWINDKAPQLDLEPDSNKK